MAKKDNVNIAFDNESVVDGGQTVNVNDVIADKLKKKHTLSARIVGQIGESASAYYLKSKGYRVIGRNIKFKKGEVDILCVKDGSVRLVEVKTSLVKTSPKNDKYSEYIDPELNFTKKKIFRLKNIAEEIISKYPFPFANMLEFDLKNSNEGLILRDSDDVSVIVEGVAVRIVIDKVSVRSIRIKHIDNLL
jgi:Holliday junction resolvase-like predicted endonuclease